MKLTDSERAENLQAIANMSLLQKLGYVFEYYKFPLVLALIAAVALGSVLYYRIARKDALLYVAYANISVGDSLDYTLSEGFTRFVGVNPGKSEVKLYRGLYLSRDASVQNHEYAYASQLKVMAAMANGQMDVLLMNREAYDLMSSSGYLLPLSGLLDQNGSISVRIADYLAENVVILKDNDIEHLLDESIPYQAVTENVANAILISPFAKFEQAGFSGDVYLGVVGNSARIDTVLQYIDYLTAN